MVADMLAMSQLPFFGCYLMQISIIPWCFGPWNNWTNPKNYIKYIVHVLTFIINEFSSFWFWCYETFISPCYIHTAMKIDHGIGYFQIFVNWKRCTFFFVAIVPVKGNVLLLNFRQSMEIPDKDLLFVIYRILHIYGVFILTFDV